MYFEFMVNGYDIGLEHFYADVLVSVKVTYTDADGYEYSDWYLPLQETNLNFDLLPSLAQSALQKYAREAHDLAEAAAYDDERRGPL